MPLQITVDTSTADVLRGLKQATSTMKVFLRKGLQVVARDAVSSLRADTPGERLPRGWGFTLFERGGRGNRELTFDIRNRDARAEAPVQLSSGDTTTLLEMLEFGTLPHPIYPKKPGGVLVFFWPKVGQTVFLKKVDRPDGTPPSHPGNRPYGMIRKAQAQVTRQTTRLIRDASKLRLRILRRQGRA